MALWLTVCVCVCLSSTWCPDTTQGNQTRGPRLSEQMKRKWATDNQRTSEPYVNTRHPSIRRAHNKSSVSDWNQIKFIYRCVWRERPREHTNTDAHSKQHGPRELTSIHPGFTSKDFSFFFFKLLCSFALARSLIATIVFEACSSSGSIWFTGVIYTAPFIKSRLFKNECLCFVSDAQLGPWWWWKTIGTAWVRRRPIYECSVYILAVISPYGVHHHQQQAMGRPLFWRALLIDCWQVEVLLLHALTWSITCVNVCLCRLSLLTHCQMFIRQDIVCWPEWPNMAMANIDSTMSTNHVGLEQVDHINPLIIYSYSLGHILTESTLPDRKGRITWLDQIWCVYPGDWVGV